MVLTGLGPFALVFVCFDYSVIARAFGLAVGTSPISRQQKRGREAIFLQKLGNSYYDQGAIVFETIKTRGLSSFVRKVVERLAIRMPLPDIRELSELERVRYEAQLEQCLSVVGFGVRLTPSIGMLGTILGMTRLLSTLDDPSRIGGQMSLALLTTFYGLFFSLALWTPFQQKLERVLDIEMEGCDQTLRWLELLERRKPSDYFADAVDINPPPGNRPRAA
jgi:chemotaxis protein MotA